MNLDPIAYQVDQHFIKEEYLQYLQDHELEENQVTDLEKCTEILFDQLTGNAKFSKDQLARCLMFLLKETDPTTARYVDEDEIEVVSSDVPFMMMQKQMKDTEDLQKRTIEHVKSLKEQICGLGEIDDFKVSQNVKNLLWLNGDRECSNERINIQRKV